MDNKIDLDDPEDTLQLALTKREAGFVAVAVKIMEDMLRKPDTKHAVNLLMMVEVGHTVSSEDIRKFMDKVANCIQAQKDVE